MYGGALRSLAVLVALGGIALRPARAAASAPTSEPSAETAGLSPTPSGPSEPAPVDAATEPGAPTETTQGPDTSPDEEPAPEPDAHAEDPAVVTPAREQEEPAEPPPTVENPAPASSQDASEAPLEPPPPEVSDEDLRKSGAHLRPEREAALLKPHPVDLSKASYKPGNGLEFKSEDGRFSLATRLRAQFRYTLAHDGEADETTHGMQIRRARLQFKGHFWNKHNKFKTELALSPRDMGLTDTGARRTPILDWYVDFTYLRDLSVRVGQYKLPYSRQRVVSSGDLQLVDRSLANSEFTLDRDVGLDLHSKDFLGLGLLRYNAGLYFGEGRDPSSTDTFEMLYIARVEVLPFGLFQDYKEADFERSLRPRMSLGLGYAFLDGAQRNRGVVGSVPTDGGTTDYHNATADLVFKIAGVSVFSDVFYRDGARSFGDATEEDDTGIETPAAQESTRTGIGWSAQAGYLLPRTSFELAARYAQTRRTKSTSGVADRDEVGGGASYYFAGHPMKLQLDYFARTLEQTANTRSHEVRLQLQAAF